MRHFFFLLFLIVAPGNGFGKDRNTLNDGPFFSQIPFEIKNDIFSFIFPLKEADDKQAIFLEGQSHKKYSFTYSDDFQNLLLVCKLWNKLGKESLRSYFTAHFAQYPLRLSLYLDILEKDPLEKLKKFMEGTSGQKIIKLYLGKSVKKSDSIQTQRDDAAKIPGPLDGFFNMFKNIKEVSLDLYEITHNGETFISKLCDEQFFMNATHISLQNSIMTTNFQNVLEKQTNFSFKNLVSLEFMQQQFFNTNFYRIFKNHPILPKLKRLRLKCDEEASLITLDNFNFLLNCNFKDTLEEFIVENFRFKLEPQCIGELVKFTKLKKLDLKIILKNEDEDKSICNILNETFPTGSGVEYNVMMIIEEKRDVPNYGSYFA